MMEPEARTALAAAAQAGDALAFAALADHYRPELLAHCYRMLGAFYDAEELVQDTLLRAWEKHASLTTPAAYRAWLYRIATNLCLNRLARAPRRALPSDTYPPSAINSPLQPPVREPIWLEPFPDEMLADAQAGPEERALQRERLSLAFLVALQRLTPTQRAILLLREVLAWPAAEVAGWLNLSVPAVNSALQRARRALAQPSAPSPASAQPPTVDLLARYMALWEQADIPGLAALLREDAWFTMPPVPTWFQGREAIMTALATRIFIPERQMRLRPARANGSPAFAVYQRLPGQAAFGLMGLFVLGVAGAQVGSLVAFLALARPAAFGLPASLLD